MEDKESQNKDLFIYQNKIKKYIGDHLVIQMKRLDLLE